MLTAAEIAGMRSTSASALPDQCVITRQDGTPIFNESTGRYDVPAPETIYVGPCRVRTREAQEREVEVGDLHETLGKYVGTLPHNIDGPRVDDFLRLTSSSDADLIGRPLRIVHVAWGSWEIDRRIGLEDREHQPQEANGS